MSSLWTPTTWCEIALVISPQACDQKLPCLVFFFGLRPSHVLVERNSTEHSTVATVGLLVDHFVVRTGKCKREWKKAATTLTGSIWAA